MVVPCDQKSVDPESNQGPSDLQSDALPTELSKACQTPSTTETRNGDRLFAIDIFRNNNSDILHGVRDSWLTD